MKKILLFLLCVVGSNELAAQQDPLYAQYLMNPLILNPAYSGLPRNLSLNAAYRKQWAGFEGSPSTFYASAHAALMANKVGIGFLASQDQIGADRTTTLQAMYAYHLQLNNERTLSFGLQGGVVAYRADFSKLTIDQNDPRFQQNLNVADPTIGAGVVFSTPKFFASLSMPRMLSGKASLSGETLQYYNQHAYLMTAYVFPLAYNVKAKPFALLRSVPGKALSADVGMAVTSNNTYTLGLFTRSLNSYGFVAGFDLGDQIRFGYVFELPVNIKSMSNATSHEFTVGFRMKWMRYHDLQRVFDF